MKIFKKVSWSRDEGFSHVELLIAIVVLVAVVGGGVLVYARNNKAHAASWTSIESGYGINISACETYINAYGGVYNVSVLFQKPAAYSTTSYNVQTFNSNGTPEAPAVSGNSWLFNTVAELSTSASNALHNTVRAQIIHAPGSAITTYQINPHNITACNASSVSSGS